MTVSSTRFRFRGLPTVYPQLVLIRRHLLKLFQLCRHSGKLYWWGKGSCDFGQKYPPWFNSQGGNEAKTPDITQQAPRLRPSSLPSLPFCTWSPPGPSARTVLSWNFLLLWLTGIIEFPSTVSPVMSLGSSKETCVIWTGNLWVFEMDSAFPHLYEGVHFFYTGTVNHSTHYMKERI